MMDLAATARMAGQVDRICACARRVARGSYQRDVLTGRAYLSGSDLRGEARRYGYWYAVSRDRVRYRFAAAVAWEFEGRLLVDEATVEHGRRVLVVRDAATGEVVWVAGDCVLGGRVSRLYVGTARV